jgi:all-trans-retinol dehydrogenase (NAD+)
MSQISGAGVVITGAASGLGRGLAQRLAGMGARVALWDLDAAGLARAAADIRERTGSDPHAAVVDVSDPDAVRRAATEAQAARGPIDILVNNAGVVSGRALVDLTDAQITRTLAVNTLALFWTTRALLPDMIRRGRGHIVTIASAAGFVGAHRLTDYTASKHAAVGFDDALRAELRRTAPSLVTTVVCPFYIDTGMFAGAKTRLPWLLPILKEDQVVERIARAIQRDQRRVLMPFIVRLVPLLRILPVRWFDLLADVFGLNASMDDFTGRRGPTSFTSS